VSVIVVDAHGFSPPAFLRRVAVVVADGDADADADTDTLLASLQPHPTSANPAPLPLPPWRLLAGTAGLFMARALAATSPPSVVGW
jgi:hypothetical protein